MAIISKEGNEADVLLQPPPTSVTMPPEPIYEEEVESTNPQAERELQLCNAQLKVVWRTECAKVTAQGVLCEDKTWKIALQKATSLSILSLGVGGRRE